MEEIVLNDRNDIFLALTAKKITFRQAAALLRQLKIIKEKKVSINNDLTKVR